MGTAWAEEARTALVVGVENYHDLYFQALGAPVSDARALQGKLQALGFQVNLLVNPSRRQLTEAVDAFGSALAQRGGVGLFFFSGHGAMKSDESANFLIPAGTNIRSENDLPEEAFNAQRIANRMKEAKNRLNLIFLDACRNHGLPQGDGSKSASGGLAAMRGASGLMFFFATQPGEVAIEDASKRSLFTAALLKHIASPGVSFMDMMGDVTAETETSSLALTNESLRQSPFVSGTLSGRFYFKPETSAIETAQLEPMKPVLPSKPAADPVTEATKDTPYVNSLGQEYVPVPGTKVLFCRTDVRVSDFRQYANETGYRQSGGAYVLKVKKDAKGAYTTSWELDAGASWEQPGFAQSADHPVVCVSWNEAREFCAWLSKKEGRTYRLPTDAEWSAAVGSQKYPWGNAWPPPKGAGNYGDASYRKSLSALSEGTNWTIELSDYEDGYERTSPVGSFKANRLGLYDMGGNVWQWCEDQYRASMNDAETLKKYPSLKSEKADDGTAYRVVRGASWINNGEVSLRSSCRDNDPPASRYDGNGFRCVLVVSGG